MSLKQTKHGSPGTRAPRGGGGKKSSESAKEKPETDARYNENVVRKLYELFQDIFDYDLVASVCHTCQWDASKATEALMVLGDAAHVKRQRNSKGSKGDVNKNKPKSLPSTLKPNKSDSDKGNNSLYAMPNSLRSNPAHVSTSSLSSGQVWQRHYKSKPQSPGLLTMIPPYSKEGNKLKKSGSARSLPAQNAQPKAKEIPEVKQATDTVKRIQQLVQTGAKVLVLMRGVPGSGKTHLAQIVVKLSTNGNELSQHIFSTDDYFIMLGRGNYAFDFHQLPLAHHWNQRRVFEALRRATNPVIVDNTHTQAWEMEPYVSMAVSQGYLIEVLEPVTSWRMKEAELAKRNIHSVPREKIRQMIERYEKGWTGEKLIQLFGLNYAPCGSAHVSQELTIYNNSPLAQHRQQAVIDTPEKPKRKKNSPKKKDRKHVPGVEITDDKEKQLEELNQLFAEYGKKMDPVSKKKVLESGVPISEVVSRMRKLQGNILPLPKANIYPPTIPEKGGARSGRSDEVAEFVPNYRVIPRESPCESVEPDTMSSSNASETSECESDTEAEIQKASVMKGFFNYRGPGQVQDGDTWGEINDSVKGRGKNKKRMAGNYKTLSGITSSQEELSIIDYELSTNPACSSQEELSLLDSDEDNGDESKKKKEGSSSSSEEQETQLLTLQESLREVLIDSYEKRKHLEEQAEKGLIQVPDLKDLKIDPETNSSSNFADHAQEPTDDFINVLNKRLENIHTTEKGLENSADAAFVNYMFKSYDADKVGESKSKIMGSESSTHAKRSPDLEEVPLPSIPPGSDLEKLREPSNIVQRKSPNKRETLDGATMPWENNAPEKTPKTDAQSKPERPKSGMLGAIKKTGIQRDQSPEELLRSVELSWSSIPFTSSWEEINKKAVEQKEIHQRPKPQRKTVNKTDSSTNTMHSDFYLWKDDKSDIIKLTPQNRNINQGLAADSEAYNYSTEYPMLDKGSMTSDLDEFVASRVDESLEMLTGMFPNIHVEDLADVLEKCRGNLNWAVELLLDSPHNIETCADRKPSDEGLAAAAATTDSSSKIPDNLIISDGKKTIKRRKDRKSVPSELSLLLKKQIEDGVHINEDCYQDKTLFIKQLRHGEINLDYNPPQHTIGDPSQIPEFYPRTQTSQDSENCLQQREYAQEEEEEEETIPMKIDPEFFRQLAMHFGHFIEPDQVESPHSVAVVNIPVSLGYQIYSCWLETVNRQIEEMQTAYDNMIKEDELLAKALQELEHDQHKPDLREIMDMELAMALYKEDEEQTRGIYQDTLACKLSKQLLFESYPKIDRKMILDIFRRQGYSFHKTVELLESQKGASPITVIATELLQAYENKLIEEAKLESEKKEPENLRKPIIVVKQTDGKKCAANSSGDSKDVLVINPAEFRQNMTLLQKRRYDCCRQAQEAFRNKNYSVASYYSHIASLYKERISDMNKKFISREMFDEKRSDSSPKQLDLHFLFVPEALKATDLFLDYHIKEINRKNINSLDLNLITGRGLKSRSQKPKIKPAIKKRLEQRKILFVEQNPGMLRVTVHKNDSLSDHL